MPAVLVTAAVVWLAWTSFLGVSPTPVTRIATGPGPCGEAAAAGWVWVATDRGGLVRIDPRTNRVTRRLSVGRGACAIAAGAGAIWVTNYLRSTVVRVDLRSGRTRSIAVDAGPFDALVAFGRLWVTAWEAGRLDEIDLATLQVVRRIDVGPRPVGLASRGGGVWVGFGRDATAIARVDPASRIVEHIEVGDPRPGWFVRGTRDFWIQANDGDVLHVDPANRRVLARLHVGRTLARGATAPDGTIWMPDKEQSLVYRIDPVRERVIDSFPAGPGAFQVLRAFGSMWVISYAGDDVRRFRP
jgi:DNA-binding beta-propeller fold protein YncE